MRNLKTSLLAATIMATSASPAFAQFAFPTVQIDGAGATTIGDVNVKVQQCIGVDTQYGTNASPAGTLETITAVDYTPSVPSLANPEHRCSTGTDVYNGATTYTGQYIGTGSGLGIQSWRNFRNQFVAGVNSLGSTVRPFGANPFGTWTNLQYAFTESPIRPGDITDYNADDNERVADATSPGNFIKDAPGGTDIDFDQSALAAAGPAIQIPLYVIPIAVAYNPTYGFNAVNQRMNFNVRLPVTSNGVGVGGLRLRKSDYCGIFNGSITNWNDPLITLRNSPNATPAGQVPLFDPLTDSASRWATDGAPIRLVGRADRSGGTDVTTRALAAQCGTTVANGGTNKFERAAQSLPYDQASTIDIRPLRSDTGYRPAAVNPGGTPQPAANLAGSAQSIGGRVWANNGQFCNITNVTGGNCSVVDTNANTPGLFILADGSSRVEAATFEESAATGGLISVGAVQINGKVAYLGADFVTPTPGRRLHSAALQVGINPAGASFVVPSALTAGQAFGTVRPPQSPTTSGVYNVSDVRQVWKDLQATSTTFNAALQETVDRANPIHWANVLYPAPFDAAGNPVTVTTLANPTAGYPITGPAYMTTYTCFSTPAKTHGVANFLQYVMGRVTKKAVVGGNPSSISLNANTFPGTAAANLGTLAKSNTATVPAGWRTAIVETFLKRSTQKANGLTGATLGSRNLWIQSAQALTNVPHTQTGAGASPTNLGTVDEGAGGTTFDNRNPQCVVGGVADNASPSLPGA